MAKQHISEVSAQATDEATEQSQYSTIVYTQLPPILPPTKLLDLFLHKYQECGRFSV